MAEAPASSSLLISTEGSWLAWIAGQPFLFVETLQSFCALRPDVATHWEAFETGVPESEVPEAEAMQDAFAVASDLMSVGAIAPLSHEEGVAPVAVTETLALGSSRILLTFEDDDLRRDMLPSFTHLRSHPGPTDEQIMVLRGRRRIGIARRNGPISWGRAEEAVPLLKIALTETMLDHLDGLALHVAMLVRHEKAMIVLGAPGAGKSTLALGLHCAGFDLAGDDLAQLRRDGTVQAMPFAVTLKHGAWKIFETRYHAVTSVETYHRPDGNKARYLPIDAAVSAQPRKVGWIVVLDRREGAAPELQPLPVAETFGALLGSAWSGDTRLAPEGFDGLAACIDGAVCVRFTYSDLDAATAALTEFCDRSGS